MHWIEKYFLVISYIYIVPYADHDDQVEYNHAWCIYNRDYRIEKMTQYYNNNKTQILKQKERT